MIKEILTLVIAPIVIGVVLKLFAYWLDKQNKLPTNLTKKAIPASNRNGFCVLIQKYICFIQLHISIKKKKYHYKIMFLIR